MSSFTDQQQLKYFLAVAEELNFTKAAKRFYISQTAMTQQIRHLEDALGVRLFDRTNRKVSLTVAGKVFVEEAQAILARTDHAISRVKSTTAGQTGSLSIGFVKNFENTNLGWVLKRFHDKYPGISISLDRAIPSALSEGLNRHLYDCILTINLGSYTDLFWSVRTIRNYPLYAVVYPGHPLAHRESVARYELRAEQFILNELSTNGQLPERILLDYARSGFSPDVTLQSDDIECILLLVSAGIGIAILPQYTFAETSLMKNLVAIPLEGEHENVDVILAHNRHADNPALERFLEIVSTFSSTA